MIRPRDMSQGAFAELLREAGFESCSKAAVSLAERPKDTGVQFTPEAKRAARGALNLPTRQENRTNGRKTTVWLDDETRAWLETQAYLTDTNVGEIIRRAITLLRAIGDKAKDGSRTEIGTTPAASRNDKTEKAASDAGTSEAAGE